MTTTNKINPITAERVAATEHGALEAYEWHCHKCPYIARFSLFSITHNAQLNHLSWHGKQIERTSNLFIGTIDLDTMKLGISRADHDEYGITLYAQLDRDGLHWYQVKEVLEDYGYQLDEPSGMWASTEYGYCAYLTKV